MIRGPLLAAAIAATALVGILTGIVVMNPYLSIDATFERDIQATNLGPLTEILGGVDVGSAPALTDRALRRTPEEDR